MGVPLFQAGPGDWDRAVEEASGTLGGGDPEASVFHEERVDWRLAVSRGRPVERVRTFSAGAAFEPGRAGTRTFWASAPGIDDLGRLARTASVSNPGESTPSVEPVEPFRELEETILRIAAFEDVDLRAAGFRQAIRIAAGGGPVRRDSRQGAWLRVDAMRTRGGRSAVGRAERVLGNDPSRSIREGIAEAIERSRFRLDARPVDPGATHVVFAPGVGGVLIHELIGHAVDRGPAPRVRSWLSGRRTPVGPPEMTVVDDPRRGRAAWRFDDEGVEARATVLVRHGRVGRELLDRAGAKATGGEPTGHGRRATFRDPVLPRMGATFLGSGPAAEDDALASTARGIFIVRMSGARFDPARAIAVFRVTDAEAVDHGRRTHAVRPFLLTVSTSEAPLAIDSIASKIVFDSCIGSCLRAGQPLATSVGAPTFRLGGIRVLASSESDA